MELLLTDEQALLRDSAATFADRLGGAARLRDLRNTDTKIDRNLWRAAAEAGWLAILAGEESGGLGLGLTELCLVSHQLGRRLVPEPVCAVAAVARALGGSEVAEAVVGGEALVVPALAEGPRAIGDEPPTVAAEIDGETAVLAGSKTGVPCPSDADGFLVSAAAGDGVVLVHVARENVGDAGARAVMDGSTIADLDLSGTHGTVVAGPNETPSVVSALLDALHLANAAELLGIMETAQEITVDYLKIREQFDRPIGSFQALQHRAVDNLAAIEMCRSLIFQAAGAIDAGGGAPGLASAALSRAAKNALDVTKASIQMHGGIGFTDEHDIGLYLKRAMTLAARYGNAGLHRKRYADSADHHA